MTRRCGRRLARLALLPVVVYFLVTSAHERRASADYLSRVFGRRPTWREIASHFHCFAATLVDRVTLLAGDARSLDIRLFGERVMAEGSAHRGCLAIGAHLGSFDVMRSLAATDGHRRLKVLMYPEHNPTVTRALHALRPALSDTVIPLGAVDTLLRVRDALRDGDIVGILADRAAAHDRVTRCRFLGEDAQLPAGPILLASALKVPTVLFFALYRGGNRYDVIFEKLADEVSIRRETRDDDVQHWMQRYADRLEHHARLAPYNWFNFYDFWGREPS